MTELIAIDLPHLASIFVKTPGSLLQEQLDFLNEAAREADVNTVDRWAMYLAHAAIESDFFTKFEEDLNYSAEALLRTWPRHFDQRSAPLFARQPEKIANRVYAMRMGNGDENSGDGWRFRGRGAGQLTGFNNYLAAGKALLLDLRGDPDLASGDARFLTFSWFWSANGLNRYSDAQDVNGATRVINGGYEGLNQRNEIYELARAALS